MAGFRAAALAALGLTAACATGPMMTGGGMAAGDRASFGGLLSPESVTYDAAADRYFVTNAGADVFGPSNDGYIAILAPDGRVIEPRWAAASDSQELISPLGSAIFGGSLYVCDRNRVRQFDLETGAQTGLLTVAGGQVLNDLAVAADGTVYVTDTGGEDPASWKVYRITDDGAVSVFLQGEAIPRPNGLELDPAGDVVVVALGSNKVQVFAAADARLLESHELPVEGNDGVIALADALIVSSVFTGTIYEIDRTTGEIRLLADDLPSAASIAYDPGRRRIVVPQLQASLVTFLPR
jgi:DNA-binding beta-propeller fold protein YncE